MTKKELKAIDVRVERAYYASCRGIQIDIMDIGKVFAEGRKVIAEGLDDVQLQTRIRAFVESIRKDDGNFCTFQMGIGP